MLEDQHDVGAEDVRVSNDGPGCFLVEDTHPLALLTDPLSEDEGLAATREPVDQFRQASVGGCQHAHLGWILASRMAVSMSLECEETNWASSQGRATAAKAACKEVGAVTTSTLRPRWRIRRTTPKKSGSPEAMTTTLASPGRD